MSKVTVSYERLARSTFVGAIRKLGECRKFSGKQKIQYLRLRTALEKEHGIMLEALKANNLHYADQPNELKKENEALMKETVSIELKTITMGMTDVAELSADEIEAIYPFILDFPQDLKEELDAADVDDIDGEVSPEPGDCDCCSAPSDVAVDQGDQEGTKSGS